jgi:hypothetical protein
MQEGKEPLRSFGDLMQFFDKDKKTVKEPEKSKPKKVVAETSPVVDSDQPTETPKPAEAASPVVASEPVTEAVVQAAPADPIPPAESSDS